MLLLINELKGHLTICILCSSFRFFSNFSRTELSLSVLRVVKGIFVKRESAVLFLCGAWNGSFISRETWFAHQPWNVNRPFIFSWSVKRVIYFPWNVICPPAVSRDSWHYLFQKWEWSFPWFTSMCRDPGFFVPPLFGNLVHRHWRIWGWGAEGQGLRPPSNLGLGFSWTMFKIFPGELAHPRRTKL